MCDYPIIHGCSIAQIQSFVTVVNKNHFFRSTFPLPPNRASFSIAYKTGLLGSCLSVLYMFSFACSMDMRLLFLGISSKVDILTEC